MVGVQLLEKMEEAQVNGSVEEQNLIVSAANDDAESFINGHNGVDPDVTDIKTTVIVKKTEITKTENVISNDGDEQKTSYFVTTSTSVEEYSESSENTEEGETKPLKLVMSSTEETTEFEESGNLEEQHADGEASHDDMSKAIAAQASEMVKSVLEKVENEEIEKNVNPTEEMLDVEEKEDNVILESSQNIIVDTIISSETTIQENHSETSSMNEEVQTLAKDGNKDQSETQEAQQAEEQILSHTEDKIKIDISGDDKQENLIKNKEEEIAEAQSVEDQLEDVSQAGNSILPPVSPPIEVKDSSDSENVEGVLEEEVDIEEQNEHQTTESSIDTSLASSAIATTIQEAPDGIEEKTTELESPDNDTQTLQADEEDPLPNESTYVEPASAETVENALEEPILLESEPTETESENNEDKKEYQSEEICLPSPIAITEVESIKPNEEDASLEQIEIQPIEDSIAGALSVSATETEIGTKEEKMENESQEISSPIAITEVQSIALKEEDASFEKPEIPPSDDAPAVTLPVSTTRQAETDTETLQEHSITHEDPESVQSFTTIEEVPSSPKQEYVAENVRQESQSLHEIEDVACNTSDEKPEENPMVKVVVPLESQEPLDNQIDVINVDSQVLESPEIRLKALDNEDDSDGEIDINIERLSQENEELIKEEGDSEANLYDLLVKDDTDEIVVKRDDVSAAELESVNQKENDEEIVSNSPPEEPEKEDDVTADVKKPTVVANIGELFPKGEESTYDEIITHQVPPAPEFDIEKEIEEETLRLRDKNKVVTNTSSPKVLEEILPNQQIQKEKTELNILLVDDQEEAANGKEEDKPPSPVEAKKMTEEGITEIFETEELRRSGIFDDTLVEEDEEQPTQQLSKITEKDIVLANEDYLEAQARGKHASLRWSLLDKWEEMNNKCDVQVEQSEPKEEVTTQAFPHESQENQRSITETYVLEINQSEEPFTTVKTTTKVFTTTQITRETIKVM